jgi:hypothetical protein
VMGALVPARGAQYAASPASRSWAVVTHSGAVVRAGLTLSEAVDLARTMTADARHTLGRRWRPGVDGFGHAEVV